MSWRTRLIHLRRSSQLLSLIGVLWLFVATEYRGEDTLPLPVSLLFRLDPLAAIADALAPGPFSWHLLWPALLLVVLTGLLGRFFCGWLCPMGTTLDGLGHLTGRGKGHTPHPWRRVKYALLLALLVASALGIQLLGLFDPLSLFLRTLTFVFYPIWNAAINGTFALLYKTDLPVVMDGADWFYPILRDNLMAFHPPVFLLVLSTLLVFVLILALERREHRFWCKNLCPLGALLGLCASRALLERQPTRLCPDCLQCDNDCRMNAVRGPEHMRGECILCMDCLDYCPQARTKFVGVKNRPGLPHTDLSRRGALLALGAGAILAPAFHVYPAIAKRNPYLLRPPGAQPEEEFLRRCIRCGECMKVCIGQALHPAWMDSGPAGLWSPILVPRIGYCEYNCTLCGQVCPTGAIELLNLRQKQKTVIGLAVIDQNLCLPFARGEECLVCEEHCPTHRKAIVFEQKTVLHHGQPKRLKHPRVVTELCIGCGICETRCPLNSQSAIRVVAEEQTRDNGVRGRTLSQGDKIG